MSDLPTGSVALLFTGIDGWTGVLHELGDRSADMLARPSSLLSSSATRSPGPPPRK